MYELIETILKCKVDYYVGEEKNEQIKQTLISLLGELSEKEEAVIRYRFAVEGWDFHSLEETAFHFGVKEEAIENEINSALTKLRHPNRRKRLADLLLIKRNYKITINNPNGGEDVYWTGFTLFDDANNKFYEAVMGQEHGERFRSTHFYRDDKLLFSET